MHNFVRRNNRGVSLIGYGLLLGLVGVIALSYIKITGEQVDRLMSGVAVALDGPVNGDSCALSDQDVAELNGFQTAVTGDAGFWCSLTTLDATSAVTGQVPAAMGRLPVLESLILTDNAGVSALPASLADVSSLTLLDVQNTGLASIPQALCSRVEQGMTLEEQGAVGAPLCAPAAGSAVVWGGLNSNLTALAYSAADGAAAGVPKYTALPHDVREVAIAMNSICYIADDGLTYCMGNNFSGQTGTGDAIGAFLATPTPISGGHMFDELHAGNRHYCGRAGTAVWCWGEAGYGNLGQGNTTDSAVPVQVPVIGAASGYDSLATSGEGACATITPKNNYIDVACWGHTGITRYYHDSDSDGWPNPDRSNPYNVLSPTPYHLSEIGDTNEETAIRIIGRGMHASSPNREYFCVLLNTGQVNCQGEMVGGGTGSRRFDYFDLTNYEFVELGGGHSWREVTTWGDQYCGVTTSGAGYCWGHNTNGQLGNGSTNSVSSPLVEPQLVAGGDSWQTIQAGPNTTCGVTSAGIAKCWGYTAHSYGLSQGRGDSLSGQVLTPQPIDSATNSIGPLSRMASTAAHGGIWLVIAW